MGREVWRMKKDFEWPLHKTWFGFLLYPLGVRCALCEDVYDTDNRCVLCYGERIITPEVQPPGYKVKNFHSNEWSERAYGWQLWETVSEGSPVSPVFDTPEELAGWLVANDTSITAGTTREGWLKMITAGWAPSMVYTPEAGIRSGVEAIAGDDL